MLRGNPFTGVDCLVVALSIKTGRERFGFADADTVLFPYVQRISSAHNYLYILYYVLTAMSTLDTMNLLLYNMINTIYRNIYMKHIGAIVIYLLLSGCVVTTYPVQAHTYQNTYQNTYNHNHNSQSLRYATVISYTEISHSVSIPVTTTQCSQSYIQQNNTIGLGIIGAIAGYAIDPTGGALAGAIVGGAIGHTQDHHTGHTGHVVQQHCYPVVQYRYETKIVFNTLLQDRHTGVMFYRQFNNRPHIGSAELVN